MKNYADQGKAESKIIVSSLLQNNSLQAQNILISMPSFRVQNTCFFFWVSGCELMFSLAYILKKQGSSIECFFSFWLMIAAFVESSWRFKLIWNKYCEWKRTKGLNPNPWLAFTFLTDWFGFSSGPIHSRTMYKLTFGWTIYKVDKCIKDKFKKSSFLPNAVASTGNKGLICGVDSSYVLQLIARISFVHCRMTEWLNHHPAKFNANLAKCYPVLLKTH